MDPEAEDSQTGRTLVSRSSRIVLICLTLIVASSLVGGWLGGRVLAGGGRLADHLRTYTALLALVEDQYVDDVKPEKLIAASIR